MFPNNNNTGGGGGAALFSGTVPVVTSDGTFLAKSNAMRTPVKCKRRNFQALEPSFVRLGSGEAVRRKRVYKFFKEIGTKKKKA